MESGSWVRVLEMASEYGYAFLFLVSVAENTFLLGLVVPGDVAIVIGGALCASGQLKPITLTIVVVLGVLLGANLSYWIGRRGGIPLIERSAERFAIEPARMKQVERYFDSHGAKTVFLASFVSGFKNLIPAVAGASKMGGVRFFAYNAAGSTLRSALLVAIGYVFGASFPRAMKVFGSFNVWILAAMLAAMAVLVVVRWRKRRRKAIESGANVQDRVDRGTS